MFQSIPFKTTAVVTGGTAAGVDYPNGLPWTLGDRFADERGRLWALWQIDPALTNDTFATGELAYLKAAGVVTNDVSDAIDGGDDPACAGVAQGSLAESTSTTTVRYGLFLVSGRATIKTNGDDDIAAGDMLTIDTSSDGGCNSIDPDGETIDPARSGRGKVGTAYADDSDSANTVDAIVSVGLFY